MCLCVAQVSTEEARRSLEPCLVAASDQAHAAVAGLDHATDPTRGALPTLLREPGAVILAGERLGAVPGGLATPMPPVFTLPADDIALIEAWIAAGASP